MAFGQNFMRNWQLQQAIAQETPEQQQAELGDLLFIMINLARWYN